MFEFNLPQIHCSYTQKEDYILDIVWFIESMWELVTPESGYIF